MNDDSGMVIVYLLQTLLVWPVALLILWLTVR